MIADFPDAPARLAPFLAQWDYMTEQLLGRLDDLMRMIGDLVVLRARLTDASTLMSPPWGWMQAMPHPA